MMGLLDFFRQKRRPLSEPAEACDPHVEKTIEKFLAHDYLGKAVMVRDKAREAESSGDFNAAWGFYQEQKQHYLKHAARSGFTKAQTLALDASVSESLANILRQEAKHHDALVHIIYWASTSARIKKSQEKKLPAYFNRCKFKNVSLDEAQVIAFGSKRLTDFIKIRDVVSEWRARA